MEIIENNSDILYNFSSVKFFKEINNQNQLSNKDEIIKIIKKDLTNGNLDSLLINLIDGEKEDLLAIDNNIIYQITTSENQKNNNYTNISTIDLGVCEDRLKQIYGIDKNLSLIILKIDYYIPGLLIPVIGYEIYHPINKTQLNLNHCKDTIVKLNIPVSIDEDHLFKYDPNSEYYTDDCYTYTTENGTDILISDRKNEYIDNNLSLCENNCIFNGYDQETKKALCQCETKPKMEKISDIISDENLLSNNFSTTDNTAVSNLASMKCMKTLFTKDGLITNIGNYLILISLVFFVFSSIAFYKCGYQFIENNIKEILLIKNKNKDKKSIFKIKQKDKKCKKNNKGKKKKKSIKSNPIKKALKNLKKIIHRKGKFSNTRNYPSKLELNNTNIIINLGKKNKLKVYNKTNKIKPKIKEKNIQINKFKNFELNSFTFKKALKYDKRTFCQLYLSLYVIKNIILFSFYPYADYNLKLIKIKIFFLSVDIHFSVNILFFYDSTIHKIYENNGVYDIKFFISKIILSFIISYYIIIIIIYFSMPQKYLLEIKNEENLNKVKHLVKRNKRCLIIKYVVFYILCFLFLTVFWFFLSSFCAVYPNSQIYAFKNTVISYAISLLYPLVFYLLPIILRILSLKKNNATNKCIYKLSTILQLL